jgi:predicted RNA methylase
MSESRYLAADPSELDRIVAHDLNWAFGRRGAKVLPRGGKGRVGFVVDAGDFCIAVEVARRKGARAASRYLEIVADRAAVERELGKPAHLLFSCIRTPEQIVRSMAHDNACAERAGSASRVLFLALGELQEVLGRLRDEPSDLYPNERWKGWFEAWQEIGSDAASLERLWARVLTEDGRLSHDVETEVGNRAQAEQERLRKDVRKLEDVLRLSNVTGPDAMRSLVYLMFVKLFEEKRELDALPNRFTLKGFAAYRKTIPELDRTGEYHGRTLHHLLDKEIKAHPEIRATGMLRSVALSNGLTDGLIEGKILPVLDDYHFRGTRLDALGAVFEAVARRAEKDTRIGQFFTPEPIVRFVVDVVRPGPAEVVLDPAAGTGRFLSLSMEHMVARAGEVRGKREEVIRAIRRDRLLGCDTDEWIVTIARMNMYILGDGGSRIYAENGLFLADAPVLDGRTLQGAVDVCVTNPPLGAMSYRHYAADLLRRHPGRYADASEWLRERLPILPGEYLEDRQIREAEAKIARWKAREREAVVSGDARAEARARRFMAEAEKGRTEAVERRAAGRGQYVVQGDSAKGGALFLAAIRDYLKPVSDPAAPSEWRGGRLGIIVDEAILNTPEYAETRRFIRRHYFVKAVFSFDRDAFWYQARTTAKTSLLYLVRKEDEAVKQREPVFYGHVNRIGFTRTGKHGPSDIRRTREAYQAFERAVRASYRGAWFDAAAARGAVARVDLTPESFVQWPEEGDGGARLDYAGVEARQLRAGLPAGFPVLGDFVTLEVRNPPADPSGIYSFATVDRTTGEVRKARTESTEYPPSDLREIREGDIVMSGIDLVNGAVGYAYRDVSGRVVSKEFYTLALKPERAGQVDARFLALLLQTRHARAMVAGSVTGTSNRTRIQDASALLALPLPPLPAMNAQRAMVAEVERALEARRDARAALDRALDAANSHWAAECARPVAEPELAVLG